MIGYRFSKGRHSIVYSEIYAVYLKSGTDAQRKKKRPPSQEAAFSVLSLPARRFEQAYFRLQENDVDNEERREQNADRPEHVAKEGRHLDAAFAHDAHAHQIGSIADVSHCAHEHSTHGNGHQRVRVRGHHFNGITAREVEEGQIGRRIVEEGRQRTGEPEEHHVVEFAG